MQKNVYFQKMMYKFHIVLETEHFLLFCSKNVYFQKNDV